MGGTEGFKSGWYVTTRGHGTRQFTHALRLGLRDVPPRWRLWTVLHVRDSVVWGFFEVPLGERGPTG